MKIFHRVSRLILPALALSALVQVGPLAAQETAKPVKLLKTQAGSVLVERQFFGQVAAKQSVDLAFQVGGQVLEFPVAQGTVVPEGQLVAQLDLEPFELKLEQARLQKAQADRTVARMEKLTGTVSQVSIDDAETQAGLAGVALRDAEYALQHATLTAPFDALVSSREVEKFTTVSAGTPIVRLHDMSELHIKVDVPEILFQQANADEKVDITASFPGWDATYPVEILEFDAEASSVGQTYRVTFRLAPPKDRQILPGASVSVRVLVNTGAAAIRLPATAIVVSPEGQTGVMVFSPTGADNGTVAWRPVTVTPTQDGDFTVTEGLTGGEEVVLAGGTALSDGQAVRRFAGFAN
ncbi:efflux RND transporter periplasmic adaptor subunit [Phaeobacter gallaeciensis]|jgi:RND family efflux transporter MFP subunit|uniref:efflux RND transporter periplasmic adaptor subunit n=1 Tax=Rhodobacterales TaxID=204455 RepID=UPI00238077D1|nr:efflux RND transporter periplasmic adaptor subunit [Phaeobacter gallaeciensis]MDE4276001.1 efflux RND transporter periplasmic adaptor subunit [Phaeobacter gallaeciensis]MDE4301230.1 efflux RND transporter periplasmic adaptor subunit [Phaeobacter gallaeciensis]MDE5186376.1 efflux RND transporter periplasmic adaptor subunit [Phaeobacter gallaeciensis]